MAETSDDGMSERVAVTVRERLQRVQSDLSRSEQRIATRLLENYPLAGFGSLASLAESARVSPPTVLRLLDKLGFASYPAFREQVHVELAELLGGTPSHPDDHEVIEAENRICDAVSTTLRSADTDALDTAAQLLADRSRRVLVSGGSYSHLVATYLAMHLSAVRPDVVDLPPDSRPRSMAVLDVREDDVLVLFDYFYPQPQTTAFGREMVQRGARLVLITDSPAAPLSAAADLTFHTQARGAIPLPSFMGGFALVEALIAAIAARLGDDARARIRDFVDSADDAFGHWMGSE